ncbi:MAG: hypothetical protein II816_01385 [Elusimicrobia bacterium]|nr:hypothetical protein [Elusimicrobiota bacterium]
MSIFYIILGLLLFSLAAISFPKYNKIFVTVSLLSVFSFYFFLSANFFHPESFYPSKNIKYELICCNYYNLLYKSLKEHRLYLSDTLTEDKEHFKFNDDGKELEIHWADTSPYKDKIYLYFGITPVLLLYAPFHMATNLYLTDKFLVFVLACISVLFSIFLIHILSLSFLKKRKVLSINPFIVFLIGFCSTAPYLLVRSSIYEAAIITANVLVLISFIIFYFYLNGKTTIIKNTLLLLLGTILSLSVGARPQCVLFIPAFFTAICIANYYYTKDIKYVVKQAVIFLIPCIIIGTGLALYNYLRFDSIFEFGFNYQTNGNGQKNIKFKDLLIGLKYNLFQPPQFDWKKIFHLNGTMGHTFLNESIVGIFWTFPMILIFLLLPKFLKNIYKENKNTFIFILLLVYVIVINLILVSLIGMSTRFLFEFVPLMIILSMVIWNYYMETSEGYKLKFFRYTAYSLFFYSILINTSLFLSYQIYDLDLYLKIIDFLF